MCTSDDAVSFCFLSMSLLFLQGIKRPGSSMVFNVLVPLNFDRFCKLCEHQACVSACSHFIIFQLVSCQRQHIEYLLTWSFLFLAAVPTVTHNSSHVLHWSICFSTFTFYHLLTFHPFPQATDHPSAVWWQDSARKTTWALQASTCLATSWRPRMAPSTCKARFNLSQKAGRVNLWTWNKRLILHPFR